jgi:hypothetical protein
MLVEGVVGGLAIAIAGGIAFYYVSLLFLSVVSLVLPLAGGRPKVLLDWRRKRTRT